MDKKIHVIHLTTDSIIGGTERMILTTVLSLNQRKYKSTVVTLINNGPMKELCENNGIPYFGLNMKSKLDIKSILVLYRFIKNSGVDILNTYLFHASIIGRIIGFLSGARVIVSSQRNVDLWRKWHHNLLDRLTSVFCGRIISNSYAGKDYLVNQAKIKSNLIDVIHNGIDISDISVPVKKSNPINILNVASLTLKKGHIYLFEALKLFGQSEFDYVLRLVGAGPMEPQLKSSCHKMGISGKVVFEGYQEDILPYLKNTDIFVLPSLWEGLPVALMEAMGYGIPCIASDTGGVRELLDNGINGLLVEPKNPAQIANALLKLAKDDKLRETIGKQSRKKIEAEFSVDKMARSIENVYEKLLSTKGV